MDSLAKPKVTWEYVIARARALEGAAMRNDVAPEEGARLVRLVLEFDENITGSVRKLKAAQAVS